MHEERKICNGRTLESFLTIPMYRVRNILHFDQNVRSRRFAKQGWDNEGGKQAYIAAHILDRFVVISPCGCIQVLVYTWNEIQIPNALLQCKVDAFKHILRI